MRKAILAFALALLAATPAANQAIDFNTLNANQSGNFTWISSAPSGSNRLITYSDYKTYVQNQTSTCTVTNNAQIMTWSDVISCAQTHTASRQSESVSGNYHTITYTARFNSTTGLYTCVGPSGSDGYSGTPVTLPAGTVAPSSSTPLSLTISSLTFPGTSTSIVIQLKDPSGTVRFTSPNVSSAPYTATYTTAGAAGAWTWTITQNGGSDGACDSTNGVTNFGGTQVTWSGSASWYE